jgi:hypothetical protein
MKLVKGITWNSNTALGAWLRPCLPPAVQRVYNLYIARAWRCLPCYFTSHPAWRGLRLLLRCSHESSAPQIFPCVLSRALQAMLGTPLQEPPAPCRCCLSGASAASLATVARLRVVPFPSFLRRACTCLRAHPHARYSPAAPPSCACLCTPIATLPLRTLCPHNRARRPPRCSCASSHVLRLLLSLEHDQGLRGPPPFHASSPICDRGSTPFFSLQAPRGRARRSVTPYSHLHALARTPACSAQAPASIHAQARGSGCGKPRDPSYTEMLCVLVTLATSDTGVTSPRPEHHR